MHPLVNVRGAGQSDAEGIARVHVASWEQHYPGLLPDDVIAARTFERRVQTWRRALADPAQITFVSRAYDGSITGFANARVVSPPADGFDAYLQAIYLLADVKMQGTGKALLRALAQSLLERGCTAMALRVLRANAARGFYEH